MAELFIPMRRAWPPAPLKPSCLCKFTRFKLKEISFLGNVETYAFNAFKLSMLNFDQALFYNTYNRLLEEKSFRDIFYGLFIPIIQDIGLLWQTHTIKPSHEHFIIVHIRQKVLLHIERIQSANPKPDTKTFVLFLPVNEIHDIGLLFINYELLSRGYHTIYLGENVPISIRFLVLSNSTFVISSCDF